MTKYCLDLMKRSYRGQFKLVERQYFDDKNKDDIRSIKKDGLEAWLKREKAQENLDSGRYLITVFREKRKRNGAIRSKKKLAGCELVVK
jgi:hypothetical protein